MKTYEALAPWLPSAVLVVFAAALPAYAKGGAAINRHGIQVKVITSRDCKIYSAPDTGSKGENCPVFRYFYVLPPEKDSPSLEVVELKKGGFYRIASGDSEEEYRGWLHQDDVVEWHHREALQFAPPKGRELARFFLDAGNVLKAIETGQLDAAEFREPESTGGSRIIIPLLEAKPHTVKGERNQVFRVAFMSGRKSDLDGGFTTQAPIGRSKETVTLKTREGVDVPLTQEYVRKSSSVDIVFVVDTTGSMGPPIAQVRNSIAQVSEILAKSKELQAVKLRFGLVGYRDADDPRGYLTRIFCNLDEGTDFPEFQKRLDDLDCGGGGDYPEDVLAGIWTAVDLDAMRWNLVGWKQIIVVGDASIKGPDHPDPACRRNAESRTIAQVKARLQAGSGGTQEKLEGNFVASVVHVKLSQASEDHPIAKRQFEDLVAARRYNGIYLDAASGEDFSAQLSDHILKSVSNFLKTVVKGEDPAVSPDTASVAKDPTLAAKPRKVDAAESSAVSPDPVLDLIRELPRDSSGRNANLMSFRSAYCSEYDGAGDLLFETYVFTRRGTLSIYQSILGLLKNSLEDAGPVGNRNVEYVVQTMKTIAATLFSGKETIDKDTPPEVLIQQLMGFPVRTPLLKKPFAEIANMPQADYDDWVRGIEAQVQSLRSLIDNSSIWFALHSGATDREKHAFIPLTDFP